MSESVKAYLRLVARWLIDDDDNDDERNDAWDDMTLAERLEANQLVQDIFEEWL